MAKILFDPDASEPFPVSRSKLQLFLDCARCFVLDRKYGIGRPDTPPYTLNNAVDVLLKREFDGYRARGERHPLLLLHGVDAVPLQHPELEVWREPLRGGLRYRHSATNVLVTGAPDDLWITPAGAIIVVDYKATCMERTPSLDDPNRAGYRRQLECYQWLLRRLGYDVDPVAYALFANADRTRTTFGHELRFTLSLSPHCGDDAWVDDALADLRACLEHDLLPPSTSGCLWCAYRAAAQHCQG